MASANTTLARNVETIESDSTGALILKGEVGGTLDGMKGYLINKGPSTVFIKVACHGDATPTGTVATTDVNAKGVVGIPSGCQCPVLADYKRILHNCASGNTSVLYWFPES